MRKRKKTVVKPTVTMVADCDGGLWRNWSFVFIYCKNYGKWEWNNSDNENLKLFKFKKLNLWNNN